MSRSYNPRISCLESTVKLPAQRTVSKTSRVTHPVRMGD